MKAAIITIPEFHRKAYETNFQDLSERFMWDFKLTKPPKYYPKYNKMYISLEDTCLESEMLIRERFHYDADTHYPFHLRLVP